MKSMTDDFRFLPVVLTLMLAVALGACGSDSEARESVMEGSPPEAATEVADEYESSSEPESSAPSAPSSAPPPAATTRPAPAPARAEAPAPPPPARLIPAGTLLVFEVLEEISTASHGVGDTFRLRLVEGAAGTGGASLAGHEQAQAEVIVSQRSPSSDEPAVLEFTLESIQVAGRSLPIQGTLEAAELQSDSRASGSRTAATIAGGTAAGALIGQVFGGNTRSTVAAAAVGAIAGTGIALANRDGHAVLPEGSLLSIRLTDPLAVP